MNNRKIDYSSQITRTSNWELDRILGAAFPILDHGFVRLVDYMGNDQAIVDSARVSYGKGTKAVNTNEGLINYLMRHAHTTPFEMCELKFHVKMPVFVARQWIRHRTASINEISGRYSVLDSEFYVPKQEHLMHQSTTNKQGRSGLLTPNHAENVQERMTDMGNFLFQEYGIFLEEDDLARELARLQLPLSTYTQFYWKTNLHNLFHFLKLRMDSHAQYEIRVYADKIAEIVEIFTPLAFAAFKNHVLESVTFSAREQELLNSRFVSLDPKSTFDLYSRSGLSKGEIGEMETKIRKVFKNGKY